MKNIRFILIFLCLVNFSFGQTKRDILLNENIPSLLASNNPKDYFKAKNLLLELEETTGFLPQERFQLLNDSFEHQDLSFFKKNLRILTKEYGFNLILLNKGINYYKSLTTGELSLWFRKVYPKDRAKWLRENYEKIPYLKQLNDLAVKDQTLAALWNRINSITLSEESKKKIRSIFLEKTISNFQDFLWICKETQAYPTSKTFSLTQTPYFLVTTHMLKTPGYSMEYLKKIYPYWEEAYLSGNMDYLSFLNFDSQLFLSTGKQYFGLLKTKEIPEYVLKMKGLAKEDAVPVLDEENLGQRRKNLGWD
ncbi:MAG TPA: hypothetical protein VFM65_07275 [Flavobacteriaceae bacterium]|nr:hypothetical protein [Flavobacteriaceae bacterium]